MLYLYHLMKFKTFKITLKPKIGFFLEQYLVIPAMTNHY